jgi:hypothetical protein
MHQAVRVHSRDAESTGNVHDGEPGPTRVLCRLAPLRFDVNPLCGELPEPGAMLRERHRSP